MATVRTREPLPPGAVLKQEFLDPLGISVYQLCKETPLREDQVGLILKGKRRITARTDAVLCRYLGLSRGFWRRMQISYEDRRNDQELKALEAQVTPYAERHAAGPSTAEPAA
jgi:addiction module HigA family antidote